MKPVSQMSRVELAAYVADACIAKGVQVVLSGGSCVSIYSSEKYVSKDLDFVTTGLARRSQIHAVMQSLGFSEEHRYFSHPDTPFFVEFPPGPLGVGDEPVRQIEEIRMPTGVLRLLSPTDCVKDRLAWYYHDNDRQCLEQAILVAQAHRVDLAELARWSGHEGKADEFERVRPRLLTDQI